MEGVAQTPAEIKQEKARLRSQKRRDLEAEQGLKNVPFKPHVCEVFRIDRLKTLHGYGGRSEYLIALVVADEEKHLKTLTPEQRAEWRADMLRVRDESQNGENT